MPGGGAGGRVGAVLPALVSVRRPGQDAGQAVGLAEQQKSLIMRAGGNARDIAATEAGEVEWDWEMLAS